jgi:polar amino acid transport system substrate-binding protein
MRRFAALAALAATLGLVVGGLGQAGGSKTTLTGPCAKANLNLVEDGRLTVGADNPAFPPWFGGDEKTKPWKTSDPYSGQGYESAVAYAVARRLGFSKADVQWTPVPFGKSYAPGKKPFDFYITQVSYLPARAKAVDFSISYYFVNQAVVGLKGKPIAKVHTVAGLKPYTLGVQIGTTSYDYIVKYIKPSSKPKVYDSNNDAVSALKNGQIDGLVVDFPSTGYITNVQVPNSVVVGRLPTKGTRERFGLVFQKGNSLVPCVNRVLNAMWRDGTLKRLERTWLAGTAPILK